MNSARLARRRRGRVPFLFYRRNLRQACTMYVNKQKFHHLHRLAISEVLLASAGYQTQPYDTRPVSYCIDTYNTSEVLNHRYYIVSYPKKAMCAGILVLTNGKATVTSTNLLCNLFFSQYYYQHSGFLVFFCNFFLNIETVSAHLMLHRYRQRHYVSAIQFGRLVSMCYRQINQNGTLSCSGII